MAVGAEDIARYFLTLTDEEADDLVSNLKLQKLVYYAQGFNLALHKKPLFNEKIEAWTHGPVIPELYHKYKKYSGKPIPPPRDFDSSLYDDQIKQLLDEIFQVYGQYSAWKLRELTHEEPPWKNAYENKADHIISNDDLFDYFQTLVKK
jgi:uncharacterized phage-associated protein